MLTELDLSYARRYSDMHIPEAYEALILDVIRGEHANFVRADELREAWRIFTPLLHRIDNEHVRPQPYGFGSRGPAAADEFVAKHGYRRPRQTYEWPTQKM